MGYHTDGRIWPSSSCGLNLTGPAWPSSWVLSAQAAMDAWNSAPRSRFSFSQVPGAPDHLAAYDLGRWNGWLAMTYTQPISTGAPQLLTSGQVLVNLHYEWNPKHPTVKHSSSAGAYDLESVLVHELGHLLHLDDEPTARVAMLPTISPGTIRSTLGADDIAGIVFLYPMLSAFEIAELTSHAARVVRGRVVAANYATTSFRLEIAKDSPEIVCSVHRVQVAQDLKGHGVSGTEIDIITLGGQTPNLSMHIQSEATLVPNEEVVLFLSQDHLGFGQGLPENGWNLCCHSINMQAYMPPKYPDLSNSYSVFGGFQGKYSIYKQDETNYAWRRANPAESADGFSLEDLQKQIESAL